MKRLMIAVMCLGGLEAAAQTHSIERVLQEVERNNKELQAGGQALSAQKAGTKIENNLANPEVTYSYQYGKRTEPNQTELNVTQGFDFPTQYGARSRYGKWKDEAYERRFGVKRREVLLKAEECCLELISLNRQKEVLAKRKSNAEELVKLYEKRLEEGDANVLEVNKVKLECMAVNTEAAENEASCRAAWQRLLAMNGEVPLAFAGTDYPLWQLPVSFDRLRDEVLPADEELRSVEAEREAARKFVTVSKNGWLPGLQVGYRRSGSVGEEIHGFIVGGTLPLFENRGKVKKAKAESVSAELEQQEVALRIETELRVLFDEAQQLKRAMEAYDLPLMDQTSDYLKQALMAGRISVIEYFTEQETICRSRQKYMELEYRYHIVMARIYKNRL